MKSTRSKCSLKTICARSSTWIASSSIGSGRFLPTILCCAELRKIRMSIFRRGKPAILTMTACPDKVQAVMDKFAQVVGRSYHLFDYVGAPDAERVIVMMGSGAETAHETVDYLNQHGEKVGLLKVRLYRPFSVKRFIEALPATVRKIAVLDRTKEAGAAREPLYLDVVSGIHEGIKLGYGTLKIAPETVGGRYGLSSKEFTPALVKAVYDNLAKAKPKDHFTVGIHDDVSHTSLDYDSEFSIEPENVVRAMFYGLGADGTVGANKNSIKIIGENTDNYGQGYFVYDSKKSGAMTVSHLRFGPQPIRSSYLISKANFVGCHQWIFLERYDMLRRWFRVEFSCSTARLAKTRFGISCRAKCKRN